MTRSRWKTKKTEKAFRPVSWVGRLSHLRDIRRTIRSLWCRRSNILCRFWNIGRTV